jgi:hypothetical protein
MNFNRIAFCFVQRSQNVVGSSKPIAKPATFFKIFKNSVIFLTFLQNVICCDNVVDQLNNETDTSDFKTNMNCSLSSFKTYFVENVSDCWNGVNLYMDQSLQKAVHFFTCNTTVVRDYSIMLASLSIVLLSIKTVLFLEKTSKQIDIIAERGFSAVDNCLTSVNALCNPEHRGFLGRWLWGGG